MAPRRGRLDAVRPDRARGRRRPRRRPPHRPHPRPPRRRDGPQRRPGRLGRAQGTPDALAAAESRWGRSYVDHLRLLGDSGPENQVPLEARAAEAARALMAIPVAITAGSAGAEVLVQLHRGPNQAAQQGLDHARAIVHACTTAIADLRTAAL
ncbi:hypothetical protein [Nannocystis pusilla]|uniref:hypothetical protein n=1 Tax=Nannocystis pusilla TaxID=889268 RepID=UPI003B7BB160